MAVIVSEDSSESLDISVVNEGEGSFIRITNTNDDYYVNIPVKLNMNSILDELSEAQWSLDNE